MKSWAHPDDPLDIRTQHPTKVAWWPKTRQGDYKVPYNQMNFPANAVYRNQSFEKCQCRISKVPELIIIPS